MITVIKNVDVVDVDAGTINPGQNIVIEDGLIREVSQASDGFSDAHAIDLNGLTILPGLIDAHVHVTAYTANLSELNRQSPGYVAARTARVLRDMLSRGFTTVRDVGGADFGIARAVEEGYFAGPRVLYGGKALSPTGGHGDLRPMGVDQEDDAYPFVSLGRRCDGLEAVRLAARDEIRRGAHHIKIMANGGISSPTDRITSDQFSEAEIAAIVDEAEMANLYVVAHTYTARSVARAVRNGVRSIEHGNLIDEETVGLMKEREVFFVPTLAIFRALADEGVAAGYPPDRTEKISAVLDGGIRAVELAHRAGIPMAYGTDLIGPMQRRQLSEFGLRLEVVPPADLIRSATIVGAELLRRDSEIGRIAPGYRADFVAVRGDPFDAEVLKEFENRIHWVMKDGREARNDVL
jgi:imidazolonepropionase-like amidohydrolase